MSSGSINVVLNLDSSGFNSSLTAAQRGLQNLNLNINNTVRNTGGASSAFSNLGSSIHGIIINAALAGDALRNINAVTTGVMYSIAKTNGELERMQKLMTGMSKASTQAAKEAEGANNMQFVLDMAKNSPVALKGLTDAFVKLKTTGIDPTIGSMRALVDANAHFGGNEDSLKRASIAISQMSSKGKVSMEELRQQLAEAIPNASALMARGMGMSMDDFIKAVSKGTVNSKAALAVMFREMERDFAGSSVEMMKSWTGMTSQLETQWMLFQKQIGDAGFFEEAKLALGDLIGALKTDEVAAFAASFGHMLADVTRGAVSFAKSIAENRDEISKWMKIGAEALIAFMAWTRLVAVGAAIAGITAAMNAAVGVGPALIAMLSGIGINMTLLLGPIGLISAAIVGSILVWNNWGGAASANIAKVAQAAKDGVKIDKRGLDAIAKAKQDGAIADEMEAKRKTNPTYRMLTSDDNTQNWIARKKAERDVAIQAEIADVVSGEKRASSAQIEAQNKRFLEVENNSKTNSLKKTQDNFDLAASKKIDQPTFFQNKIGIEIGVFDDQVKGINEITDAMIQEAKANNKSTEGIIKNRDERIRAATESKQALMLTSPDFFTIDTKAKDKAAKDAAKEIERQNNIEDNMRAQLAKKTSILGQSRERGADVVGPGPNEAKIRSMIADGHAYTEETIKLAAALDQVDKKLVDQGKSFDALDGQLRNSVKNVAKSAVDLQHSKANAANGGYETMSKETLRMNEQMEITEETISRLSKGVDQNNEAWIKETAAVRANTAEYVRNQSARDAIDRDNKAMVASRVTNASLNETVRGRLDEEYALKVETYKRENELVGLTTEEIKAKHKGMYAELTAMEDVHARQIENPLKTMARSWGDMSENIKQASTSWMSSFSDEMTKMVTSGKADFRSLTVSILKDLARIAMQKALVGIGTSIIGMFAGSALSGAAGSSVSSLGSDAAKGIGGGTGMSGFSGGAAAISPRFNFANNFANGGIMTSMGKLPLNAYASGGIAKTPQVAIFGEGRKNEAFVPLPDGKSIPVTMKGKDDNGTNVSISINVADNGTASKNQQGGNPNNDMWGKMADNIKGIVVQTITEQKRPGGQLYSR